MIIDKWTDSIRIDMTDLKRISKDDKLHRAMSCRCQYFLLSFYLEILLNIRYFQTFRFRLSVFASIQEANIIFKIR